VIDVGSIIEEAIDGVVLSGQIPSVGKNICERPIFEHEVRKLVCCVAALCKVTAEKCESPSFGGM
jgi:hypothetical protein